MPFSRFIGIVAVLLAALGASPATAAEDLLVECEEFVAYGGNDLGGYPLTIEYCSGASEYQAVDGLDLPGEWIRLKVTFPTSGCYRATLAYQASYTETLDVEVRLADAPVPGQDLPVPFLLDDGYGFG